MMSLRYFELIYCKIYKFMLRFISANKFSLVLNNKFSLANKFSLVVCVRQRQVFLDGFEHFQVLRYGGKIPEDLFISHLE